MRRFLIVTATMLFAGSAFGAPAPADLSPLVKAFATRLDDLQAAADGEDRAAQFALSILRQHGLRGLAKDAAGAKSLRARSLTPAPGRQITQYIPGIGGAGGQVTSIYLPARNPVSTAASQVDRCVAVLERTASSERSSTSDEEACGGKARYVALASLWDRARPWGDRPLPTCHAADKRCLVLRTKVQHLNARDPVAEARAAAARGDFRLGGFNTIGPSPSGWDTPGVACGRWTRDLLGKWHVTQDVLHAGDGAHTQASLAFLAAYNRTVVNDRAFPYPDVCAETAVAPGRRYPGVVSTYAEAARSGDIASLEAAASGGGAVNGPDPLRMTALAWAAVRNDEAMQKALLSRGADPNIFPNDEAGPLALALKRRQSGLARALLAKGARMAGETSLCPRPTFFDPGERPSNDSCTWAGLLIAAGEFDVLDQQAAAGGLGRAGEREPVMELGERLDKPNDQPPSATAIDGSGELQAAFFDAVSRKDAAIVQRLLVHVGHGPVGAVEVLDRLYGAKRADLVRAYVLGHGATAARSEAEADLWRVAARNGRDEALAFLHDFGADLNLLSPTRFRACQEAVSLGDLDGLLVCVRDAGERRTMLRDALSLHDFTRFDALAVEAVDVRERLKPTLVQLAAAVAPASTLKALLARGGSAGTNVFTTFPADAYAGRLKSQADAWRDKATARVQPAPVLSAARRGDAESVRLLVDAGAPNLFGALSTAGRLGNPPPGLSSSLRTDVDDDTERLPGSPGAVELRAADLLAGEIARTYGAATLEQPFREAVFSGYDDAAEVLLARGFDPRLAKSPDRIWGAVSGFDQPCKPSTIRLLLRLGLPTNYPASEFTHWPPLHSLAPRCRNPRSAAALAAAVDVNSVDVDGETALDLAERYGQIQFAAALKELGGKSAAEVAPARAAQRQQDVRASVDVDLEQSERL